MGNKSSTRAATSAEKAVQSMLTRSTTLTSDTFALTSVAHHGIPSNTRAMAYCSLQGILVIGTANGSIKLYGKDGLEVVISDSTSYHSHQSISHAPIGVVHMKFTSHQRLLVTYTDSSIRLFDLSTPHATLHAYVAATWTMCSITCVETTIYQSFPFIYIALDDGTIHVLHEDTGKISTYTITPRDLGIVTTEEEKHLQYITAMAVNPRDPNLLLLAYEASTTIFLWDLAKHKLNKDFTLMKHKPTISSNEGEVELNTVQCFTWHGSGKRFVAGYKHGGFGVFRMDKTHGLYHTVTVSNSGTWTPIQRIQWLTAPPYSKNAHLAGAIIFIGGQPIIETEEKECNLVTVVYPPQDLSDEEILSSFTKSERLLWSFYTFEGVNHAHITSFAIACDHVDHCSKLAPFSVIVLSGNPLDGVLPSLSIQSLPCFIRLCSEEEKEVWEWRVEGSSHVSTVAQPVPPLLQQAPLQAFIVVEVGGEDSTIHLQRDLRALGAVVEKERDDEWPLSGGSIAERSLTTALSADVTRNSTLVVTGHANGHVLVWEVLVPTDPTTSHGVLRLLTDIDVILHRKEEETPPAIASLVFCAVSRTLIVGFATGAIAVFTYCTTPPPVPVSSPTNTTEPIITRPQPSGPGFYYVFGLHIHSSTIKTMVFSSLHQYLAVADEAGVVSLINLLNGNYELVIFDISSAEPVSAESLLICELVQVTEVLPPVVPPVPPTTSGGRLSLIKSPPRSPFDLKRRVSSSQSNHTATTTESVGMGPSEIRETIPVLCVGRGNGHIEMFHAHTAVKLGEFRVDSSGLTSMLMIDAMGRPVKLHGRSWEGETSVKCTEEMDLESELREAMMVEDGEGEAGFVPQVVVTEEERMMVQERLSSITGSTESPHVAPTWCPRGIVELRVPPGSLGLHLSTDITQHAVVVGFVPDNETADELQKRGGGVNHVLLSINGVDLRPYPRDVVCSLLATLGDVEKVLVLAQGFQANTAKLSAEDSSDESSELPTFLVCVCGKSIHLVPAIIPRVPKIDTDIREQPLPSLASITLSAPALIASIVRVPVHDRMEHCLVVLDQSQSLYVLTLPSLNILWTMENVSSRISYDDGLASAISYNGELLLTNAFGEVERFSLLAETVAREMAALEHASVSTRVWLNERSPNELLDKSPCPSPKKKGIADAGKMFKKLVIGTKENVDLHKVFFFSVEESERLQLMGDRTVVAVGSNEKTTAKKTTDGLMGTKEVLAQASQHLHERGEKLSDLALKTEQMKDTAEDFYKTMKAFNAKNAQKKWYEM